MSNSWTSLAGNARNGNTSFDSSWRAGGYEYALLVERDWSLIVYQRQITPTIGDWVSHDISSTVMGIAEVDDSHKGISIGVDPNGIVHVSGNTHDTAIRHIQTVNPHDISSWVEAPRIDKMSKWFTNLVENGVVENNQNGWDTIDANLYTIDRVSHPYGWGSSTGNDLNCWATRLTRTANTPSTTIGYGTARSISGSGFPVTAGSKYTTHLSMRAAMVSSAEVQHQLWLVFRNGNTEVTRVASETRNGTDPTKWYRPSIIEAVAPVGTNNAIVEFRTIKVAGGNATTGDAQWVDGLMLYEGDVAGDIVYRDGSFNGGTSRSEWTWDGTPYASTSQGPIRAPGYAGINELGYSKYSAFSDGTLLLSGSQPVYVADPVGRAWSMWKMEPGTTEFVPLIDGSDGCIMRNTMSTVLQGSSYPVLSTGNPANDDFISDRAYSYGAYVDKNDYIHVFCWFRVKTDSSFGSLLYMKSTDRGQTWSNITGNTVTVPLTYPASLTDTLVSVDGSTVIDCATIGGVTTDDAGHPYITVNQVGGPGRRIVYWDGTNWQNDSLASYNFDDNSVPVSIRGDIWLFGVKTVTGMGTKALWGVNHTQNTGPIIRLGAATIGTPDGVYQFEDGATYGSQPVHAGGMDSRNNYIYRTLLPDYNTPRIVQFGAGVKRNKV